MAMIQSIDSALEETIGAHGASDKVLNDALGRAESALDFLRVRHADGSLPLLRLPDAQDDLASIRAAAVRLREGASDIVVLGTGGSSLGGQTLAQPAGYAVPGVSLLRAAPRVHFIDNLDPLSMETMLARLPLASTRFVAISKSGGTAETLMQTIAVLSALKQVGLDARNAFLGISEPVKAGKRNGMRDLLTKHHVTMLDHDPGVGGRFSALTNVGLLPAAALGLDIAAIRQGAGRALAPVLAKKKATEVPAALGAALNVALTSAGKNISVLMVYSDRPGRLSPWYVQLWAESLGKNGKGSTPVAALGPVDQHSQLQLFLDGPGGALFTILTTEMKNKGPLI